MATSTLRQPTNHGLSLDSGRPSRNDFARRISPLTSLNQIPRSAASANPSSYTTSPDLSRRNTFETSERGRGADDNGSEDPLSKANTAASSPIITRTASTFSEKSQPQVIRSSLLKRAVTDATTAESVGSLQSQPNQQDKKKAVSFISRFLATNKKRSWTLPTPEETPKANNGLVRRSFSRSQSMDNPDLIDNIEFAPRFLQPAPYTKVRSKNKRTKELDRLFLAQELSIDDRAGSTLRGKPEKPESPNHNAIWALAFSRDGKYLAAGGQNHLVKVWSVLGNAAEREAEDEEYEDPAARFQLRAAVFKQEAVRTFTDHNGPVLDLVWSKNDFLLTTSQDKTVRLFHPTRAECLCTFKHSSQVHSIAFHPKDDRFFLAGCKDGKLRLWSIPDKKVEYSANVNDMITAVAFAPDGKTSLAGTVNGNISVFTTEALKYSCHFQARGKKKCRVTSIRAAYVPSSSDQVKLLVTTSDSRVQLYNLRDRGLELKLKGHKNEEVAMSASFSDDGRYAICGSEDKAVYVWSLTDAEELQGSDKHKDKTIQRPVQYFDANDSKTTCAIMAPRETRIVLNGSGDPIYEICNPPPVKLVERAGSVASSNAWNGSNTSVNASGHKATQPRSLPMDQSPALSQSARFDDPGSTMAPSALDSLNDSVKSAAHNVRAEHLSGQIILTASTAGIIRVYRQDCAFAKRSRILDLDPSARRAALRRAFTGTTQSSRSSISAPHGARPVSVRSSGHNNREQRLSVTLGQGGELVTRAKRADSNASSSAQPTRDRIERWRDDIDPVAASNNSVHRTNSLHSATSASMVTASESPAKSMTRDRSSFASAASSAAHRLRGDSDARSPSPVKGTPGNKDATLAVPSTSRPGLSAPEAEVERRRSSFGDPLRLRNGQSMMFWNMSQYEDPASPLVRPGASTRPSKNSVVSRLTSEESFDEVEEGDPLDDLDDDEVDENVKELARRKCPRCGGQEFRIKESRAWSFGKMKSIVCEQCGLERRNSGGGA